MPDKAKSMLSAILVYVVWTAVYLILIIGSWSIVLSHFGVFCKGFGVLFLICAGISMFKDIRNALRTEGYKAAYPGIQLLLLFLLLFGLYKLLTYLVSLATALGRKAYDWYEQLLPPGMGDGICIGLVIIVMVILVIFGFLSGRNRNENWRDDDGYY